MSSYMEWGSLSQRKKKKCFSRNGLNYNAIFNLTPSNWRLIYVFYNILSMMLWWPCWPSGRDHDFRTEGREFGEVKKIFLFENVLYKSSRIRSYYLQIIVPGLGVVVTWYPQGILAWGQNYVHVTVGCLFIRYVLQSLLGKGRELQRYLVYRVLLILGWRSRLFVICFGIVSKSYSIILTFIGENWIIETIQIIPIIYFLRTLCSLV